MNQRGFKGVLKVKESYVIPPPSENKPFTCGHEKNISYKSFDGVYKNMNVVTK